MTILLQRRIGILPVMAFIPVMVLLLSASPASHAAQPRLKWTFPAESNLYAPPLVADVAPAAGSEVLISDSEVRRLKCVDAKGHLLWTYDGGWHKRLTSSAAISHTARPGKVTLAIGDSDGTLCCLDAASGHELWRRQVGTIQWGSVAWGDLDGDGQDELIAGTEDAGILAFTASGEPLWSYHGDHEGDRIRVSCPIAVADMDGDRRAEVFAADVWGLFCLASDGLPKWRTVTGDRFLGAVVIADVDRDGRPEVLVAAADDPALFCLDAFTGHVRWRCRLLQGADTYAGSSLAVGDIDGKPGEEIVIADQAGHVYCISTQGNICWTFSTEKSVHAAVSLGDVDGDRRIDVLVASGDHNLYGVSDEGQLKWRYTTELRLISPATIADVDGDGETDILLCGSDRTLRCLTLGGRYRPQDHPWPSRRFDAAQSGSNYRPRRPRPTSVITEQQSLLPEGGFERGQVVGPKGNYPSNIYELRKDRPRGWHADGMSRGTWRLDDTVKLDGTRSVRVVPGEHTFVLVTDDIQIDRTLDAVDAVISVKSRDRADAYLRWKGLQGTIRQDALTAGEPEPIRKTGGQPPAGEQQNGVVRSLDRPDDASDAWVPLAIRGVSSPRGAKWLQLVCVMPASQQPTWWDAAQLTATRTQRRSAQLVVNQVGYDLDAPKRFTAFSNFAAGAGSFQVVADDDSVLFAGPLRSKGRVVGAYGHDWGFYYWRGDFTDFNRPGHYRIQIALDGVASTSWPFTVGPNVLWDRTARPAYLFFHGQRCGTDVPGIHRPCHLDDATNADHSKQFDLAGGWHDAGDYNKYHNAPYVLGLARAYGLCKTRFDRQDDDGNGISDMLDEVLWGADFSRRMIAPDGSARGGITSGYGFWSGPSLETDNRPMTGDERTVGQQASGLDASVHAFAMAKVARYASDRDSLVAAAQRALDWTQKHDKKGAQPFGAALDLFLITGEPEYAAIARQLFTLDDADTALLFDTTFHTTRAAPLADRLVAQAETMLKLADNPFGVYAHAGHDRPNFFGTPADRGGWHVGTSSHILQAADQMGQAYQFKKDPRYLAFIYDQFNWILGNNPYNISLMEGQGSAFPPTYHHRYTFGGVPRGAVPGSVVNGITWRAVGDDRPYFDMRGLDIPDYEPNEVWLPHNTWYLKALARLQALRDESDGLGKAE
ncbi:MAG: glycoside hydrolase family 9 protein [Pirellulales bacterium]